MKSQHTNGSDAQPPRGPTGQSMGISEQLLRRIVQDLHWMARRYCDGRQTYATGVFNTHTRALLAPGIPLNPSTDGTIWARDAMGRAYDGLSEAEAVMGEEGPLHPGQEATP